MVARRPPRIRRKLGSSKLTRSAADATDGVALGEGQIGNHADRILILGTADGTWTASKPAVHRRVDLCLRSPGCPRQRCRAVAVMIDGMDDEERNADEAAPSDPWWPSSRLGRVVLVCMSVVCIAVFVPFVRRGEWLAVFGIPAAATTGALIGRYVKRHDPYS